MTHQWEAQAFSVQWTKKNTKKSSGGKAGETLPHPSVIIYPYLLEKENDMAKKRHNIKAGHKQRPLTPEQLREAMEAKLRAQTIPNKRKAQDKKECRDFRWQR
jgi:hypothetical protein